MKPSTIYRIGEIITAFNLWSVALTPLIGISYIFIPVTVLVPLGIGWTILNFIITTINLIWIRDEPSGIVTSLMCLGMLMAPLIFI